MSDRIVSYGSNFVGIYDDLFRQPAEELDFLDGLISDYCPKECLDIGAGNGRLFNWVVSKEMFYTGIDISREMLDEAASRINGHRLLRELRQVDARKTYLAGKEYDLILIWGLTISMLDLEDQRRMLKEAISHLKFGGKLILQYASLNLFNLSHIPESLTLEYARQSGKPPIIGECEKLGNWWVANYSWVDNGDSKSTSDRVLFVNKSDYTDFINCQNFNCYSCFDKKILDASWSGITDVLVIEKKDI